MGIFSDNAASYFERGLYVTPLRFNDKIPVVAAWQECLVSQEDLIHKYPDCNIGQTKPHTKPRAKPHPFL